MAKKKQEMSDLYARYGTGQIKIDKETAFKLKIIADYEGKTIWEIVKHLLEPAVSERFVIVANHIKEMSEIPTPVGEDSE